MALSVGEQIGANVVDSLLQYGLQRQLNKQQEEYNVKNMKLSADLSQALEFRKVAQSTDALRAAGLNPALAQGASFNGSVAALSASNGQIGRGNTDIAALTMADKEMSLLEAQKENLEANTAKIEAETGEIKERTPTHKQNIKESESRINLNSETAKKFQAETEVLNEQNMLLTKEFQRKIDEDNMSALLAQDEFKTRYEHASSQYEKDFWNTLYEESKNGEMTVGTLVALRNWVALNDEVSAFENQDLARQVQNKLLDLQIKDNDVLYSLAHMSVAQYLDTLAHARDLVESAKFRKTMRELGIPAQAELQEQQTVTINNNDFVGHVKNGEYGQAAVTLVPGLLRLGGDVAMMYMLRGKGVGSSAAPIPVPQAELERLREKARRLAPTDTEKQGRLFNQMVKEFQMLGH